MSPFRDLSYDAMAYAEVICGIAERKKKYDFMPEESYESIVRHIACWLEEWLSPSMPQPSNLNCVEFIKMLRNDVFHYLGKDYAKAKGIRTTYNFKK